MYSSLYARHPCMCKSLHACTKSGLHVLWGRQAADKAAPGIASSTASKLNFKLVILM